jgi:hypothetical protein
MRSLFGNWSGLGGSTTLACVLGKASHVLRGLAALTLMVVLVGLQARTDRDEASEQVAFAAVYDKVIYRIACKGPGATRSPLHGTSIALARSTSGYGYGRGGRRARLARVKATQAL